MTCSMCGSAMFINGSHWQCPNGHLGPRVSFVPITGPVVNFLTNLTRGHRHGRHS